ncbi:MAG: hypothetical protein EBR82_54805 [Caulobacteraceae bacterium]|nr:hypothetical protein [Caulobacteraceae bacterium]
MVFDLSQYQTVQERIDLFWAKYPDGRLNLEIVLLNENQVVMKAEVFLDKADEKPAAVDFAEERLGTSHINKTSFVENCATSAYGRAISALGNEFSPKGKRPSASEMDKVNRAEWEKLYQLAGEQFYKKDLEGLRLTYKAAQDANLPADKLEKIQEWGKQLGNS